MHIDVLPYDRLGYGSPSLSHAGDTKPFWRRRLLSCFERAWHFLRARFRTHSSLAVWTVPGDLAPGDLAALFAKLGEQLGEQQAKLGEQLGEQLRPIAAALQRCDAVSISGVDSMRWQQLEAALGLAASPSPPPAGVPPRSIPAFTWDDRIESAQSERYMAYLKQSFALGSIRQRTLTWIAGDAHRDLLSVSAPAGGLPFTIKGTCDAAVVTTEAYRTNLYNLRPNQQHDHNTSGRAERFTSESA